MTTKQNKAIARDAALTGLPTKDKSDAPTLEQRAQWGREYAAAQHGAQHIVEALNTIEAAAAIARADSTGSPQAAEKGN